MSTTNKSIRLLIASNDGTLRAALVMFFGLQEEFEVVGEAANPVEARTLCALLKPDVLLLAPNIQRKDIVTFIGSLCQDHSNTKVVVLSFNSDGVTAEQYFKSVRSNTLTQASPYLIWRPLFGTCIPWLRNRIFMPQKGCANHAVCAV
jgi:DNA-binding NarL/FixJ family response regulator